jgi:hypothetical protein
LLWLLVEAISILSFLLEDGLDIVLFNSRDELLILVSWSLYGLIRLAGGGANRIADVVNTDGATGVVEFKRLGTTFNSDVSGTIGGVYLYIGLRLRSRNVVSKS